METVTDFIFLTSKITVNSDCSHEIKRRIYSQSYGFSSCHVQLWGGGLVAKLCLALVTPWTGACQAPLSMGFSRQEYWSGLPFLYPGDLPDPGIKPRFPALQADSLLIEIQIWELDHKEGWTLKNWCFWSVVLENSWESLGQQGNQTSQS